MNAQQVWSFMSSHARASFHFSIVLIVRSCVRVCVRACACVRVCVCVCVFVSVLQVGKAAVNAEQTNCVLVQCDEGYVRTIMSF